MSITASIPAAKTAQPLAKARTGVTGLDEVTLGGLPAGVQRSFAAAPAAVKLSGNEFSGQRRRYVQ